MTVKGKFTMISATSRSAGTGATHTQTDAPASQARAVEQAPTTPEAGAHMQWLGSTTVRSALAEPSIKAQWSPHKDWSVTVRDKKLNHFTAFDWDPEHPYIWRFTSLPSTELVSITANTGFATIIQLIGEHSGGNMKTDPRVRTSSFCRNIGALLGVAASAGGDKKVLNIINRTPYLCRIDLTTLPARGITAAPALYRAISLFETEYVLVPTPAKTYYLADTGHVPGGAGCLDAVLFNNPFYGCIDPGGTFRPFLVGDDLSISLESDLFIKPAGDFARAAQELPPITPEARVQNVLDLDPGDVVRIVCYAQAVSEVAGKLAALVLNKDPMLLGKTMEHAAKYAADVDARYNELLSTLY
ncbi:hypothetical protein AB0H76_20425 [Nocardia sp. NPDC050712]|uniref:hypothetical protein n=1 Tax=Nocardia sp. NPDC050712 TaxID=3155518 RepID=UPI0033F675C9